MVPFFTDPKTGKKYTLQGVDFNSQEQAEASLSGVTANSKHSGVVSEYTVAGFTKYATYVAKTK